MGRSVRCRGRSLLNHCHQTNKLTDLKVEYILRKDLPDQDSNYFNVTDWVCNMSFNNIEYSSIGSSKKNALLNVLNEAEPKMLELIS
jgi:hypothetical protein